MKSRNDQPEPAPIGVVDMRAIFGETPAADAYTRQLEQLTKRARAAEVAAQLAERKAADAERALHANADCYKDVLKTMSVDAQDVRRHARAMNVLGVLILAMTFVQVVIAVTHWIQ